MQVNTNSIRLPVANGVTPESSKAPQAAPDKANLQESASLNAALANTPDVRRSEVERATRLVEVGNYPPPELIDRLSRLLADVITDPKS